MFKMNLEEARAIWRGMLTDEELEEWLALKNARRPEDDDPSIPKGCTIVIDPVPKKITSLINAKQSDQKSADADKCGQRQDA
jgi:hypothetical protein